MYATAWLAELTLQDVIRDIPHDSGAIVVYVVLAIFIFLIWYGSRPNVVARYSGKCGDEVKDDANEDAAHSDEHVGENAATDTESRSRHKATVAPARRDRVKRRRRDKSRIAWIG